MPESLVEIESGESKIESMGGRVEKDAEGRGGSGKGSCRE